MLSWLGREHLFDCTFVINVKGGVLAQASWGSVTVGTLRAAAGLNPSIGSSTCVRLGVSREKTKDVLSQVWSQRLQTGACWQRRFRTSRPEIGYLSLCDGILQAGSWSPTSHVVPSGSRALCQPFSPAHTLLSTTHRPPERFEHNEVGSPHTQKLVIGLRGVEYKFFSSVFHNFPETGPT